MPGSPLPQLPHIFQAQAGQQQPWGWGRLPGKRHRGYLGSPCLKPLLMKIALYQHGYYSALILLTGKQSHTQAPQSSCQPNFLRSPFLFINISLGKFLLIH